MNNRHVVKALLIGAISSLALASAAYAFQEAPMLAEQVKAGTLPPVDQRLPLHPTVMKTISTGTYGGTWHRAYKGPGDRWGPTKLMEERVVKFTQNEAGGLDLVPGYIESYSVNDNATEFTFTLLEGLKWSDGQPVTTEDVRFWYEDVFLNKDILPSIDKIYAPGGKPLAVEIVDDRTFKVKFEQPCIYFLTILAKDSTGEPSLDRASFVMPAHYLKKFHSKYASEADLAAAVKDKGVEKWTDLWGSKGPITAWNQNPDLPVLTAWKITVPPPADVMVMERNPYYYAVDSEGNQLPYMDKIEHTLFEAQETFNLMAVQGQLDMQARYTNVGDFTFYKENEEKGGFHTVKWTNAETWSLIPNYNSKDTVLADLYANEGFRHALSVSVDRETINELAFSGLGEPRAASPVTGSPYYNAELEQHWTEYDPDLANQLLDEAGLTQKDDAGFRLRPDGQRLTLVVEASDEAYANVLELVRSNWEEVGIELQPRFIDRTQFDSNRDNNEFAMQYTSFDRLSVTAADPRLLLGDDGYANQWYVWYETKGDSGVEPPADQPIRTMWAAWDKASTSATLADADAALNEAISTFVNYGYVIGLVGETPALAIAKNNVANLPDALVNDDVTRGEGLARPQTFYFKQ